MSTLTLKQKQERVKQAKERYNRMIQNMVKYKILEPNPNPDKKGEYRYTEQFFDYWLKERDYYQTYEADYIIDHQDDIREDFMRMILMVYSEKYLPRQRGKGYFEMDVPEHHNDIVEDLASTLDFSEDEEIEREKAIEAAKAKAASQ